MQLLSILRKHLVIGQFSCSLIFIGHHLGSTFTGTDRNGPNKPDQTRMCGPCKAAVVSLPSENLHQLKKIVLENIYCLMYINIFLYLKGETTISSCQAYNLLADTAMESRVFVKWQPLQDYATQAVRTNGQGLLMHTKMSPSVWISSVADNIMVKQVNIFGNVWSANITAGDMHAVFKKSTDIDVASLDEPIAAVLDSAIAVSQIGIQPLQLEGSGADFYNYTVVVLGCLLDGKQSLIESQGNLRLVFRLFSIMRGLPSMRLK